MKFKWTKLEKILFGVLYTVFASILVVGIVLSAVYGASGVEHIPAIINGGLPQSPETILHTPLIIGIVFDVVGFVGVLVPAIIQAVIYSNWKAHNKVIKK